MSKNEITRKLRKYSKLNKKIQYIKIYTILYWRWRLVVNACPVYMRPWIWSQITHTHTHCDYRKHYNIKFLHSLIK